MCFDGFKCNKNLNWIPSENEQRQFAMLALPKIYKNTQDLFYQGHLPYGVHVVYEGKIQMIQPHGAFSNLRKIECFDAPIILGAYPILNHTLYDYTAKCFKDSIISFIEKREFIKHCELWFKSTTS